MQNNDELWCFECTWFLYSNVEKSIGHVIYTCVVKLNINVTKSDQVEFYLKHSILQNEKLYLAYTH